MRTLFIFSLALLSLSAVAQKVGKPETYAKTITAADLKKHLYIVAGAEMEGRETATAGQRKAAAYIESEFKRLGLQPGAGSGYQQQYPVYQDSLLEARLEVNGTAFALNTDFNANASGLDATMRFSEVTFLPSGLTADSMNALNLAGKLVMMQAGGGMQYAALQGKGIAAILLISPAYPRTTPPMLRSQMLYSFRKSITPQSFTISPSVAQAILKTSVDSARLRTDNKPYKADVLLQLKKQTTELQSSNVLGVLPGSDLKDEYLFITAHYDHLGKRGDSIINYGADDDGSGTVGVLELADAFVQAKKRGNGPRRTIVFMTVSGEEKGLWGSEYYGDHPLFPLEKTTADLNIDMIGRSDSSRKGDTTNYVYVVGDDKISSELKPISEAANAKYTKLELDYKFNDPNDRNRIYYRSDHYNFAKNGVPIIFYYDGMLGADYHRPTDTPDKINYPLLAKRAQLVFYTAWDMANRPQMLKRDTPLPKLSR